MSKVQKYAGRKITVCFDPGRCIHVGNCVRGLPGVFRANVSGPWIDPDAADAGELAALIETCPSGALTYRRTDKGAEEAAPGRNSITIVADGPLNVHADMDINGRPEPGYRTALCRCGASGNRPYCDGSHTDAGFCDNGLAVAGNTAAEPGSGRLHISTVPDGPLLLDGPCEIHSADGRLIGRTGEGALCRCGASGNKPYCDGSHAAIGFKAA